MKKECEAFRDRSQYPASQLFKPATFRMDDIAVTHAVKRLKAILDQEVPLTEQEKNRGKFAPKTGSPLSSTDLRPFSEWGQSGMYWVRKSEGPNAHCWSSSRKGAHVLWRNADDYYCCAGFPYFSIQQIEKMQKTMEVFKPLLKIILPGGSIVSIAKARSIAYPHGVCWGMSTFDQWFELQHDDGPVVIEKSMAGIERFLKAVREKQKATLPASQPQQK
jgi:hypothetical protein